MTAISDRLPHLASHAVQTAREPSQTERIRRLDRLESALQALGERQHERQQGDDLVLAEVWSRMAKTASPNPVAIRTAIVAEVFLASIPVAAGILAWPGAVPPAVMAVAAIMPAAILALSWIGGARAVGLPAMFMTLLGQVLVLMCVGMLALMPELAPPLAIPLAVAGSLVAALACLLREAAQRARQLEAAARAAAGTRVAWTALVGTLLLAG